MQKFFLLTPLLILAVTLPATADTPPDSGDTFDAGVIKDTRGELTAGLELPVELVEDSALPFGTTLLESPAAMEEREKAAMDSEVSPGGDDLASGDEGPRTPTDQLSIAASLSEEEAKSKAEAAKALKFEDVDIETFVRTIGKITKRNFIVDSNVKGKVTVYQETPFTLEEALKIFDTVLLMRGFTTVPLGKNTWKVVSTADAKQTTIPLVTGDAENKSDVLVTQLVRLKHIAASDVQQLMQQFISKGGLINAYEGTNSLILVDSMANIARLRELLGQLDVPPSDQDISIIPVLYADAEDIADKINEILGEEDSESSQVQQTLSRLTRSRSRRRSSSQQDQSSAQGTSISSRTLPLKLIPDERTNSIIVVADEAQTDRVRALVEKLDSPVDRSGGRFHVYRLRHADAEEIAETLNTLISGASDDSDGGSSGTRGSSLSRTTAQTSTDTRSSIAARLTRALQRRSAAAAAGGDPGRVTFEGEVSIAPDPATNSLVVNASRTDYQRVKELLDALDVKRAQVMVEATILEVRLDNTESLGVEWGASAASDDAGFFAQNNFGGLTDLVTNPTALSDLTVAAASSGTITLPGGLVIPSQTFLVSAVSQNSNVNVLSTPTILTTDNEEAEIIVGENVPFVSSTSTDTSNISNTFNSIERQDVGITLRITPQISTGKFVTLNIFVEISNVVPGTRNDPNGPTTTIRTTETTVEVRSGQMIVTGGLISDDVTESTRGVPFLKDIPVLGNLFQEESTSRNRTNLLVFITPRIIRDQYDAYDVSNEYRVTMEEEIDNRNITPKREEVLRSPDLDRVVDSYQGLEVVDNVPIIPPRDVREPIEGGSPIPIEPIDSGQREHSKVIAPENDEPVELRVEPKLPGEVTSPAHQVAPPPQANLADEAQARTYVVLRPTEWKPKSSPALPFLIVDDFGTIGLEVQGSADGPSGDFFKVGASYTFATRQGNQAYVVLGKYRSPDAAGMVSEAFLANETWYSMSSEESLRLGKGPWFRG